MRTRHTTSSDKLPVLQKSEKRELPLGSSSAKMLLASPGDLVANLFSSTSPREMGAALNEITQDQWNEVLSESVTCAPDSALRRFSQWFFKSRESFHIESDLKRLSDLGIRPETLAPIMMLMHLSQGFDAMFREFGDKRTRTSRSRKLLSPISALEELAPLFGDQLPPNSLPPAEIISGLKFLVSMQHWGEWLYEFLGANSLLEVSKFALASLVYEKTGKFLDREVSSLTGAALGNYDYDETGHRVWRIQNYKRLQQSVLFSSRFLCALNEVVSHPESPLNM